MEFHLPDIGEGVAEGEIVRWHVKQGDSVDEDQPLVEVMTDKATVTIPCPVRGRIGQVLAKEGQVVPVGAAIVVFENVTAGRVAGGHHHGAAPAAAAAGSSSSHAAPEASVAVAEPPPAADRVLATPATRRRARELGVDILRVRGTGEGGRVTLADVERAAAAPAPAARPVERAAPAPAPKPAPAPRAAPAPATKPARPAPITKPLPRTTGAAQEEERVPLRGVRRKIAEHLVKSKFTAPHFTYVEEVDVTELVELREEAKKIAEARGVKLTYLPFIIKAVLAGLREQPQLNASLDEAAGEIVRKHYYNLGIATDTEQGLIVPVLKNADALNILDTAREIERLSTAARTGTLEVEELQGSTFTITSVGALGGLLATPILNWPEVAILGVHKIKKRPVVKDDKIVIGDIMLLSLSLDHRVVDGAMAARFMSTVVKFLEDPKLLLLEGI
jgi:pyruvate dehydrogenase E2 component (dihydrolipoamide acetyltransferase)